MPKEYKQVVRASRPIASQNLSRQLGGRTLALGTMGKKLIGRVQWKDIPGHTRHSAEHFGGSWRR